MANHAHQVVRRALTASTTQPGTILNEIMSTAAINTNETFIWSIAEILRGDFKQSEYQKVVLPLTVLRCLDAVLTTGLGRYRCGSEASWLMRERWRLGQRNEKEHYQSRQCHFDHASFPRVRSKRRELCWCIRRKRHWWKPNR